MTVVVSSQSSENHEVKAGVPQSYLLSPTLFLLYIYDLPKNILR